MALPKDYADERCSLARALEVVGERWTLLIVRDAFFGVRRFGDFAAHLEIPRAVLTSRLTALVEADVLTLVPGAHGHDEYALTGKGLDLWPVVRSMLAWGTTTTRRRARAACSATPSTTGTWRRTAPAPRAAAWCPSPTSWSPRDPAGRRARARPTSSRRRWPRRTAS